MTPESTTLTLSQIKELASLQPRASMNMEVVSEYAALMKVGEKFPPVQAYFDGTDIFLVDGYHRLLAAKSAGLKTIEVVVIKGTLREATLYSVGANAIHGLRRSPEDKRRAVLTLLNDEEWGKWSDSEIARKCAVSQNFVSELHRASLKPELSEEPRKVITKHGTETTMKTGNIGKKPEKKETIAPSIPPKTVKCTCEYYDAIMPGCIRSPLRICPLPIEQRKQKGCNLEGMQPPNGGIPEHSHGILAICKTRNKGEPCEHFTKRPMNNNRECSLTGYLPGNMIQCPLDAKEGTEIPITEEKRIEIAAKVAHVPVEQIRPHNKTGPFTPASDIKKGLVDLDTPDTRTATQAETYVPPGGVSRTDPLDKANGVVRQKTTDYETLAKEGDMYPLSKLKARVMNQMVEYGLAADNLDANVLFDKEGPNHWLEKIDAIIEMEGDGE